MPMDMIVQGRSTSLFQASQQWSTMSSYDVKTRFDSQLSRMNCQTFSTGLSFGLVPEQPTTIAEAGQLSEIRAHIAGIKDNKTGFVIKHSDDPRVIAAVLVGTRVPVRVNRRRDRRDQG